MMTAVKNFFTNTAKQDIVCPQETALLRLLLETMSWLILMLFVKQVVG